MTTGPTDRVGNEPAISGILSSFERRVGFPLHAVTVVVPIGALVCSVLFDLGSRLSPVGSVFPRGASWLLVVGLVSGALVGVGPLVRLARLSRTDPRYRDGCIHVALTDGALALFLMSWVWRRSDSFGRPVPLPPLVLSLVALVVLGAGLAFGARFRYALDPTRVDGLPHR